MPEPTGGLAALGINWKIFLSQLINFGIIVIVLWRFMYRPLLKTMNDRTNKIDKGLKDAEKASIELRETEVERRRVMQEARKEGEALLAEMRESAKQEGAELVWKAKKEAELELRDARARVAQEREQMMGSLRAELADLVGIATEKVTQQALKASDQRSLIEQAIKELPKS